MRQERKTLVMISLENRDCDYEIVDDSVEYAAYELYDIFHGDYDYDYDYDYDEENGDQIFTFSAMGMIPETEEEREALETSSDEGKAAAVFNGWDGNRKKYIYFKADFDGCEGPENFAEKEIDIVRNGKQVYFKKWDDTKVINHELGTVSIDVTIDEKDYCLSIPAKFDEDGEPYRTGDLGIVTDENGNTFNLDEGDPLENKVPGVPNPLWVDIVEEIVPDMA